MPPGLGRLVGHEVRECDQVSVVGGITDAAPGAGARIRERVAK
jgi:hypothetical protein